MLVSTSLNNRIYAVALRCTPHPLAPAPDWGRGNPYEKGILGGFAAQNTLNLDSPSPPCGEGGRGMGRYASKCVTPANKGGLLRLYASHNMQECVRSEKNTLVFPGFLRTRPGRAGRFCAARRGSPAAGIARSPTQTTGSSPRSALSTEARSRAGSGSVAEGSPTAPLAVGWAAAVPPSV